MAPKTNDVQPVAKPRQGRAQRVPVDRNREQTKPTNRRRTDNASRDGSKSRNQKEQFNEILQKLNRLEVEIEKKKNAPQKEKTTVRRRKNRNDSMDRPPSRPRSATNLKYPNELSVWPDIKANHSADESLPSKNTKSCKKAYSHKRPLAPLSIFHRNQENKSHSNHKTYPKVEITKVAKTYKNEYKENQEKSKRTVLDFSRKNSHSNDSSDRTYQSGSKSRPTTPKHAEKSHKIASGKLNNNSISNDFSSVNSETASDKCAQNATYAKRNQIDYSKITSKSKQFNSLVATSGENRQGDNASKKLTEANLSGSTDSGIGNRTNQINPGKVVANDSKYNSQNHESRHQKVTIEHMQESSKYNHDRFSGNNYSTSKKMKDGNLVNTLSDDICEAKQPNYIPHKRTTNNEAGYYKGLTNYSPTMPEAKLVNAEVKNDLTTTNVKLITSQRKEASSQEFVSAGGNFLKKEPPLSNKLPNDNVYCRKQQDKKLEEKLVKNPIDVRDCLEINKLPAFRKALAKLTQEYDENMEAVTRNKSKDYSHVKSPPKVDKNGNYKRSNPKRRESTSPDEGISYSPDTDNSPTCQRKGSSTNNTKESHNTDSSHILIDIKGGAMRSSRPHRSSRKSRHTTDSSKHAKDETSKRTSGSKTKYSSRSNDKSSKSRTKPIWVEISKESKPTPEKHIKNNYEFHVPKSYKIQSNTDKHERKANLHKDPGALEINYKAKFIQSKLQSEINKNKKRDAEANKNSYEVQKSDHRSQRTRAGNTEENRRVLRHREPTQIKSSKTKTHVDYERKARHKSVERSISVDSSITDLSYSSTSSGSYSSSPSRRDSSSSSYSSSILTSSSHSHSSGSYAARDQPRKQKDGNSTKTHVANRPKARSDERHSRTNYNYRTKAKSHRRPDDANKRLSDENQVFETQLGSRKNRSKREVNNEDDKTRSNWQHQRLVMTSIRPGDLQPQTKPPTEKPRPGKESRESHKGGKTFEANAKDSNGSVLTIRDLYSLHHVLSDTQNGTVIAGHRRSDGMRVAIKRIAKSGTTRWGWMGGKVVPLELALICQVNEVRHNGVVEIVEWHETTEAFLLVMVRPHPSVDLYDHVTKQKRLKESVARSIVVQLTSALSHCHKYGVLHRDVKLENILFNPVTNETILIDFGCGDFHRHGPYKEFAGTPEYYPPEWFVCKQYTGESATVWSIGVLLFALLCGTLPFRSSKDITQKEITKFPSDVSSSARELILSMLRKNPRDRAELKKLLDHKWFNSNSSSSDKTSSRKTSV